MTTLIKVAVLAAIIGFTYVGWHDFIYGGDLKEWIVEQIVEGA